MFFSVLNVYGSLYIWNRVIVGYDGWGLWSWWGMWCGGAILGERSWAGEVKVDFGDSGRN